MGLTDKKVAAAKPKERPYRLWDGDGLYLYVSKTGAKSWRVNYKNGGKQKTLTLGLYPAISLADARIRCADARRARYDGLDPAKEKQIRKQEVERQEREEKLTFAVVAQDWCRVQEAKTSPRYHKTTLERLRLHILPHIGNKVFAKLTFEDLKNVVLKLEKQSKYEMSRRVAIIIGQICKYAKLNQWAPYNLADGLTSILARRPDSDKRGLPAITGAVGVGEMLQKIEAYIERKQPSAPMAAALRLFPLLALRSQEILSSSWGEIDFDNAVWNIPAARMKTKKAHEVPLSRQVLDILRDLHARRVSNGFIFRSGRGAGYLTNEGVNDAMHRAGIPLGEMCLHGWRKVFSTLCHESGVPGTLVEKSLAHASGDAVALAYNKAQYMEARRILMQWWADTLDALRSGTERPRLELDKAAMFM